MVFGQPKPKNKRKTKELQISAPTNFQLIYHLSREDVILQTPIQPSPTSFHRSQGEGYGFSTLPRNQPLNSFSNIHTLSSPLDHVIHPTTEKQLRHSDHMYRTKIRPQLPVEWNTPQKNSHSSSHGNIVYNLNYGPPSAAITPASSAYGTMTDSMGTSSSRTKTLIINPNYVDPESLSRYREKSEERQIRGILKKKPDSELTLNEMEGRVYQPAPFSERNLPINSTGRRIRSSTADSKNTAPRSVHPSPLSRPTQLTIHRQEPIEAILTPEPTPIPLAVLTPLGFTRPKTASFIVMDERPMATRTCQEVPSSEDEQETVIYYL